MADLRQAISIITKMRLIKDLIKHLHGRLYCLLLPALVRPPGKLVGGQYYTLPRAAIIQFLQGWRGKIHGRVLDVGVGTWEYPRQLLKGVCEYTATDCFAHPNIDVVSDIAALDRAFPPASFDFVICTDVIEHVPDPWVAARQLHGVLKEGGVLLLTTPFNFHLHGNALVKDYWRFSGDGLRRLLLEAAGFRTVEITPFGHPEFPFSHLVVAHK